MRDRGRIFLATLAVMLAGVLALSAGWAAAHNVRYTNRVTISPDPGFHGRVISSRPGCTRTRSVRIYRVEPGADGLLATARTESDGRWQYLSPSLNGDFYARVGARVASSGGHRHVCEAARSRSVRAQP